MKAPCIMPHEEGDVERSNTWAISLVARWQRLPIERQLHWILRVGVIGCFMGHGAYGLLTKEAWVPYFGVVGIDRTWAYRLMPWIGAMDVSLGLTMAVVPLRIVLLHLTVWGLWTAALRPLAGDSVWELVERAGNYGVPLAFLVLAGIPHRLRGWCAPVWPLALRPPTVTRVHTVGGLLRLNDLSPPVRSWRPRRAQQHANADRPLCVDWPPVPCGGWPPAYAGDRRL